MPVLRNQRHERFAQGLIAGKTATDAHEAAGYVRNDGNACSMAARPDIQARLMELKGRAAERASVTVESLLGEAEEIRAAALADGEFSAAIAAVREKGILSGKRVERSEHGLPGEFERLTSDELREALVAEAMGLGLDKVLMLTNGAANGTGEPH